MSIKTTPEEVLGHWQIQENLLQTYRVLFVASQTIIFSVASIIVTTAQPDIITFLLLFGLGIYLLYQWYTICRARGLDVSYCQKILLDIENDKPHENFMTNFKEWQKKDEDEKIKILDEYKNYNLPESLVRKKMEVILPIIFSALWIALFFKMIFGFVLEHICMYCF